MPAYYFRHLRQRHFIDPVKVRRRTLRANGAPRAGRGFLPAGVKLFIFGWRIFRR